MNRTLFNSPFLLGFEHIERLLERTAKADSYPPYNIEHTDENRLKITLAVALLLVPLGIYFWKGWIMWAVLLLAIGFRHPPLMNRWEQLARPRLFWAAIAVVIFAPAVFQEGVARRRRQLDGEVHILPVTGSSHHGRVRSLIRVELKCKGARLRFKSTRVGAAATTKLSGAVPAAAGGEPSLRLHASS